MRLRGPAPQVGDLEQLQPMQNQNAMLDACESGDIQKLQQLFKATGVRHGDAAFEPFLGEPVPVNGPPPTAMMIAAAVAHKQPAVIACLLATYRNVQLDRTSIMEAALANPDLPTLEILQSHTPSIVNFVFQETRSTLLMEACRTSDPFMPSCLLRLGADPSEVDLAGTGPLLYAVRFLQPYDIIQTMVERGAVVTSSVIEAAIVRQNAEILVFLLDRGRFDRAKHTLEQADKTGNKRIAALVWERSTKGEKSPLKRRKRKGTSLFEYEPRDAEPKWWQLGR